MRIHRQLAGLCDRDSFARRRSVQSFDFTNDIHTIRDSSKNDVSTVQPRGDHGANEKLRPVRVRAGVGHGQRSWTGVLQLEVFIRELFAVNRLASRAISFGEITTLDHKVFDHSVKN